MTKQTNGIVWKIIGLVIAVGFTAVVWIWQASSIASSVGVNSGEIQLLKPVVRQNELSIETLKLSVGHNEEVQKQMLEMQKAILEEVQK